MPNWCSNTLTIAGNPKEIAAFKKKAKTSRVVESIEGKKKTLSNDFSFDPFLPIPEEMEDIRTGFTTINGVKFEKWVIKDGKEVGLTPEDLRALKEKYGYTNWYDRNCAVLGTKWDVEGSLTGGDAGSLTYEFESAWAPPEAGVYKLSEMYPKLKFTLEYDEPGMNFAGLRVYLGGDCIQEEDFDSKINEEMEEVDAEEEKREAQAEAKRIARESLKAQKDIAAGKRIKVPRVKPLD